MRLTAPKEGLVGITFCPTLACTIPPMVNQSNFTIITNQDMGSLSLTGRFLCSLHCQQKNVKKWGGGRGHKVLTAIWVYNLLSGCKSVASLLATRKKYEERMHPTGHHYLFNIANEMQFPATRCAQVDSVCMYGKTASSGVESMNRANDDICQRTVVDILNAALILLKKESTRHEKACNQAWNHSQQKLQRGWNWWKKYSRK